MTPAIEILNLNKQYGDVQALNNVSLTVNQGEFFGLLGPNGAGKSTLINILAGLTRANSGSVHILGYHVEKNYRNARKNVGVVPQELVFDPFFTVREVLRMQAGYFGLGRDNDLWIEELLEALMLTDKASTNMRALSGGMKRRVLIAQALVHKPNVVVLDEPTAGVDVVLRQSLWRFIRRLHHEGHTIVLTTHYLEEAESLCDRIAILSHGEVIALDSTSELLAKNGCSKRVLRLTLAEPLATIPDSLESKVKKNENTRLTLQLNDGPDILNALDMLRKSGAIIVDLETENTDLEDIFIQLTGGQAK